MALRRYNLVLIGIGLLVFGLLMPVVAVHATEDGDGVAAWISFLDDPSPDIRLIGLMKIQEAQAEGRVPIVKIVLLASSDSQEEIRKGAQLILDKVNADDKTIMPAIMPAIMAEYEKGDETARKRIALLLERTSYYRLDYVEAMSKLLHDKEASIRWLAMNGLDRVLDGIVNKGKALAPEEMEALERHIRKELSPVIFDIFLKEIAASYPFSSSSTLRMSEKLLFTIAGFSKTIAFDLVGPTLKLKNDYILRKLMGQISARFQRSVPDLAPILLAGLTSDEGAVRLNAAKGLTTLVLQLGRNDNGTIVQVSAGSGGKEMSGELRDRIIDVLYDRVMEDESLDVVRAIAADVAFMRGVGEGFVAKLTHELQAKDSKRRARAVIAIGRAGQISESERAAAISGTLRRMMNDEVPLVRESILDALFWIDPGGRDDVTEVFKRALKDPAEWVQAKAAYYLITTNPPSEILEDVPAGLVHGIFHPDPEFRGRASYRLELMRLERNADEKAKLDRILSENIRKSNVADLRTVVCVLGDRMDDLVKKHGETPEIRELKGPWRYAISSLSALFLTKASAMCDRPVSAGGGVTAFTGFVQTSESCLSGASGGDVEQLMGMLSTQTFSPLDSSTLYGTVFHVLTLRELLTRTSFSQDKKVRIQGMLSESEAKLNMILENYATAINGRSGSVFNMYALSIALVAAKHPPQKALEAVKTIAKNLNDPLCVPYAPTRSEKEENHRSAAARAVPFYLALLLKDADKGAQETHRKHVIMALENYEKYLPSLEANVARDGFHLGRDGLAPYFFYPTVPYATSALKFLISTARSDAEKENFKRIRDSIKTSLLGMAQGDGLFVPLGSRDYPSSPAYVNPLVGLALLPLLDQGDSYGILDRP